MNEHIVDDIGMIWRHVDGYIRVDGDDSEDEDGTLCGGYECDSIEEGRQLLIEYGYLTPARKVVRLNDVLGKS
jgi:hypothetical protein